MTFQIQSHYERIGGEAPIRALVQRFYELMDSLPEAKIIRAMHDTDLAPTQEKLFEFLSGWMGGPQLYAEKYGHPRLRMRHAPFAIGAAERDAWMQCMTQAMQDIGLDEELREELRRSLYKTADFMRNQSD